ncbi:MAG: ATP-binding protein [Pseudomonadota bacterium]
MSWHQVTTRVTQLLEPVTRADLRAADRSHRQGRLQRLQDRLAMRRWLVFTAAVVLTILSLAHDLPFMHFLVAVGAITVAACVIPRAQAYPDVTAAPLVEVQVTEPPTQIELPWAKIADLLPDPTVLLTSGHVVTHVNAGAQAIFPRLRPGGEISHTLRHPDFAELLSNVTSAAGPLEVEFAERVPLQRVVVARAVQLPVVTPVRAGSVPDPSGEGAARAGMQDPPAILVTLKDLTEQGQFAQMRSDFVSFASHELKTPLASVLGIIETLQGPARNDEPMRDQFLDIMAAEAERMTRLIEDLLELSRVEMKMHVLPAERVEMIAIAKQVVDLLQGAAAERKTTIELTTDGAPSLMRGDYDSLVRMLLNLVNNAIRYGRDSGHIVVSVTVERSALSELAQAAQSINQRAAQDADAILVVQVSDDGPGIAEHHIPRLTERFYRTDPAQSRARGGTGLGLSIVKNVVNRHRGRLSIASTVGEGSTFRIEFPAMAPVNHGPVDDL